MFDVLVYLFENYYQTEAYPDQTSLQRKLHSAGFENDDIHDALDWLNTLTRAADDSLPESLDARFSFRGYTSDEVAKLSLESRGFIAFLEGAKILTPLLRELIIERGMALPNDVVGKAIPRSMISRSEEHTSELQSLAYLVCRLLLEKKKARRTKSQYTR